MFRFDPEWLTKVEEIRQGGVDPFPSGLRVTHTSTELHTALADVADIEAVEGYREVAVGGRLLFRNRMGKALFLRIKDRGEERQVGLDSDGNPVVKGGILQIYVRADEVGAEVFETLKRLDIGDILWVRGAMMRTRTGELTLHAQEVRLAGKTMTAFPDRFHGVADGEFRARQRYVDLILHEETRRAFRIRSGVIRYIRQFFQERDFLEVETPMLQVIPGGAAARPFITHHNALDMDLYMRIAPELYLKRLVVGGFERVFEVNRNFRNEGLSPRHNPEFTMLEFYMAWATWEDLMDLSEALLRGLARDVVGSLEIPYGDLTLDFGKPFRRAAMDELISEATGLSLEALQDSAQMEAWWRAHQPVKEGAALPTVRGKWWEWYFDAYVEQSLLQPTFVTGFPVEISPLARRNDADPSRVDRFELMIGGREIANAFSELNDPVDQAGRFEAQAAARAGGDDEGMFFDRDYIRALTYGMPPTAGEGIGIDRLVMLLTNRPSIREVILFPTLRPERWEEDAGE